MDTTLLITFDLLPIEQSDNDAIKYLDIIVLVSNICSDVNNANH